MAYNMQQLVRLGAFAWIFVQLFIVIKAQELSVECKDWVNISMKRSSSKQGFHRDIFTSVQWTISQSVPSVTCSILLMEHIPQEMYIDPDEIKSLNDTNVISLSPTNIDVELPAHMSRAITVLSYGNNEQRKLQNSKSGILERFLLPVHWRYQRPQQSDHYVNVRLPSPTVLGKCEGDIFEPFQRCLGQLKVLQYPCDQTAKGLCQWFVLKNDLNRSDDTDIIFRIPVGVLDHSTLVVVGTVIVTITASVTLVWPRLTKQYQV